MKAVESTYLQWVIQERLKFEREVTAKLSVSNMNHDDKTNVRPTKAAVCIIAAMNSFSSATIKANGRSEVDNILKRITEAALHQDGQNIAGVEVMWSPSVPNLTLQDEDIVADYPELKQL